MAVRRDEARDDPVTACVPGFFRGQACGRIAGGDSGNGGPEREDRAESAQASRRTGVSIVHATLGLGWRLRAEVMRGKFRSSFEKPVPFKPGEPARVRFTLPDVMHTFRSGHRIMVQVQSSWFPLVDRNPQIFTDIYQAKDADFHAATHRVYHTAGMASGLRVSLLHGKL